MPNITLRAVRGVTALRADQSAALPARVKLLDWGTNETSHGPVVVDEVTARTFGANQKAIGRERVALDFEHNTVPGSPEYARTTEPRPVAGHLTLVCVPGQGIFGEAITYTTTGEANAANYEDLSLAPFLDEENRVIAAHSVALTHTGAAYNIHFAAAEPQPLRAGEAGLAAELRILAAGQAPAGEPQTLSASISGADSTPNKNVMPEKYMTLAAVAGLVGLTAEADETAILGLLKERLATPVSPDLSPLTTRLDAIERKLGAAPDLTPLSARIDALETRLTTQANAVTEAERVRLIALFASEGKVPKDAAGKPYAAEDLKKLDLPTLQLLHANTPAVVPLSARSRAAMDSKTIDPNLKGRDRFIAAQQRDLAAAGR